MLFLLFRSSIGLLLICSILTGCESKKKPVANAIPAASARPKLLADTVAAAPIFEDPAVEAARQLPSDDVPALHISFEESKTVAPGLIIIIKSIPPADNAIIRDPSELKLTFTIKRNNHVIYRDTAGDGLTYGDYSMPGTKRLYPFWVPTGAGTGELLVAFNNRPFVELARRYFIRNNQITGIDTLPVFTGPAKNLDKDSQMEFFGAMSSSETWDDERGKRYISYDPTLYYEVRSAGLVLDSALTKQKIKAEYGVFKGFKFVEHLKVLVSDLPKGSPKHH